MKDKSVEANIENNLIHNNFSEKQLFLNNSNITGISWEMRFIKKEKENSKINNLIDSNILSSFDKKNIIESHFYKSLKEKDKIKFIQKIIKNSIHKEPFDFLAVKRKRYSLGYLIRQFDLTEKSKSFEENNICKTPYPLLYCISNRKLGNNSSNLMAKILSQDNRKLSKKQENVIKNSHYSKIFNTDISKLIKHKIRSKSSIKNFSRYIHMNNNNNINNTNNTNSNITNISNNDNFPFLNKYIKSKVNTYNYEYLQRNNNNYPNSMEFFSRRKFNKNNLKKNIKRWNSTYAMGINGSDNIIERNIKSKNLQNNIDTFKNKTVSLNNHRNNIRNKSIINERRNKIIDEFIIRKRNNKSDPRINEIIKDISHLKFNNQLKPFNTRINEL